MSPIHHSGWAAAIRRVALGVVVLGSLGGMALGQSGGLPSGLGRLGGFGGGGGSDAPLTIHASFSAAEGQRPAQLSITAQIPAGWHIYSLTQAQPGPNASRIDLKPSDQYRLSGKFVPNPPPKVHTEKDAYGDLPLEEHSGEVTWTRRSRFGPVPIRPRLEIQGAVNAQALLQFMPRSGGFSIHRPAGPCRKTGGNKSGADSSARSRRPACNCRAGNFDFSSRRAGASRAIQSQALRRDLARLDRTGRGNSRLDRQARHRSRARAGVPRLSAFQSRLQQGWRRKADAHRARAIAELADEPCDARTRAGELPAARSVATIAPLL